MVKYMSYMWKVAYRNRAFALLFNDAAVRVTVAHEGR